MTVIKANKRGLMRNAYFLRIRFVRTAWGSIAVFLFIFIFTFAHAQTHTNVATLKETIEQKRESVDRLKREISTYEQSIRLRQAQASSLSNQILILNDQIQRLELSIKATGEEIEATELEITQTEQVIKEREQALLLKRSELAAGLRNLWQREQEGDLSVVLAYDNVSDYFEDLEYVEQLQAALGDIVREYERLKKEAELKHEELTLKQKELETLRTTLDDQQSSLTGQRSVKAQILVDTRRSETQYQKQLQQAKREQAAVEAEVVATEKRLRETIKEGERLKKLQALGAPNFTWPIASRTITATFHDPDYPYRYIFEHPAIDIATRQGTAVKAAAGGYVAKAKSVCNGYSYIMIIHDRGYATVYGHLSKVSVSDDDFIEQGQVIGLSGGMPRTCGAGNLTTGPHLHFEVRREGIPVNPRDYL